MSALITCQNLQKSFGGRILFNSLSFAIQEGDHLGIIGPNGMGKSTLMRILRGIEDADQGTVTKRKQLTLGFMDQSVEIAGDITPMDYVLQVLKESSANDQDFQARVILEQLGFGGERAPWDRPICQLSGGWQRRVFLAAALVTQPDIVFLDEPTNHLDLETILWLEGFLKKARFSWVLVSHDRMFLEQCANRVLEINRIYPAGSLDFKGNYSSFVEQKTVYLEAQASQAEALANKVRREVDWLRKAPQARGTKAKGRIKEAHQMIEQLQEMRSRLAGKNLDAVRVDFLGTDRGTRRLMVAEDVGFKIGDRAIFENIDLVLTPGLKLGLMGPNGAGKSTLLKIFAGQNQPTSGRVIAAEGLKVIYFDQNREQLDLTVTLKETLAPHGDSVVFQDRLVHVATYAKRFHFSVEHLQVPIGELSGGERARALIARLMLTPADVLLLDEPTNDLDIETLETLAESVESFSGAVVMISHDRYLIDQVCNAIAAFGSKEKVTSGLKLFADLEQWEESLRESGSVQREPDQGGQRTESSSAKKSRPQVKLSYLEQREFDGMEGTILSAEEELEKAQRQLDEVSHSSNAALVLEAAQSFERAQDKVQKLYARWQELEGKIAQLAGGKVE